MRVIAGKARRAVLKAPPGLDTRPTTDRIKETLFNIINPMLPGCRFLDLFCGSGGIGIEALSRGAETAVFVDNNAKVIDFLNENLKTTRLDDGSAVVMKADALAAIKRLSGRKTVFDIVYMDPPYKLGREEEILNALLDAKVIDADTTIIIEADKHNTLDFINESAFDIVREKEYKTNKHFFIKLKDAERT